MPLPRWLARFNLRVTNRLLGPLAEHMPGMGIVTHQGRKTNRPYRTPVMVFRHGDRFVIALTYGPNSQWVQNVLAHGGCDFESQGRTFHLTQPRLEAIHHPGSLEVAQDSASIPSERLSLSGGWPSQALCWLEWGVAPQPAALHARRCTEIPEARSIPTTDRQRRTFWQKRYYDLNIRSYSQFVDKLRYIHRNPLKAAFCEHPQDWPWSSFRHYATGAEGRVEIESEWTGRRRERAAGTLSPAIQLPHSSQNRA